MKKLKIICLLISTFSFSQNVEISKTQINDILNNWHKAASNAKFDDYFSVLTDDAVFIGTDATENWNRNEFKVFAKPYFDKGKAWSFLPLERHIYFSSDKKIAWFDELLRTQMKICRGSGVLVKYKNTWKIKQYVLSMTIPNENTNEVVKIKTENEDKIILKLKKLN
ncbi:MAG: nuclear transport factor 2 family protein [Flavobacterium sp.]|nr:nuclear transport factor 2 family protein [Flavobacterium sp.]